jgi:NAD(P)H-hydrate epimerase
VLRLKREEIRSLDATAIDELGIPGLILMENAGRNATDVLENMLASAPGRRVAIVAGGGNNGGDGFVIARHLRVREARPVVFLVTPRQKVSGDARVNLLAAEALGVEIRQVSQELSGLGESLKEFDLIADAVGGTGINGALRGATAQAVEQINAAGVEVLAVDIPTGLDCDTGRAQGPAVKAGRTVTFAAYKVGFDAPGAQEYTGSVEVVDIGIPAEDVLSRRSNE